MSKDSLNTIFTPKTILTVNDFRGTLIRLEETIIFAMIERAQFKRNAVIYERNNKLLNSKISPHEDSFMGFLLYQTEVSHSQAGRYTSQDENAFYPDKLPRNNNNCSIQGGSSLSRSREMTIMPNKINYNDKLRTIYERKIIPRICAEGDDSDHGSSSVVDVTILQALSRRIHYGKFIAEAKFNSEKEKFTKLIQSRDIPGLMSALTVTHIEKKVLSRVLYKAATYGKDIEDINHVVGEDKLEAMIYSEENKKNSNEEERNNKHNDPSMKIDPTAIQAIYKEYVIPLTKEIEIEYLMNRLNTPTASCANVGCVEAGVAFGIAKEMTILIPQTHNNNNNNNNNNNIQNVFNSVLSSHVWLGVIPIESSIDGMQYATLNEFSKLVDLSSSTADNIIDREAVSSDVSIMGEVLVDATRYLIICNRNNNIFNLFSTGLDKTCLILQAAHSCGSLYNGLRFFKEASINLLNLHSLHNNNNNNGSNYLFYTEIDGHISDDNVKKCMASFRKQDEIIVQVLGSFPRSDMEL